MTANTLLVCVTHKATGCFFTVFTAASPNRYRASSLATYVNNSARQSIRLKLENWALKEFADAYSPVVEEDFTFEFITPTYVSKDECQGLAAAYAKKMGVSRLLSARILPSSIWLLNAQAKQRVLSGLNIYKAEADTSLVDINFPLSLVECFLTRYDSGFTTDAMRQLRKQVKQYREQACLSKSEIQSTH